MVIRGMLKTSLLDYPGRIAAILFTGGCNMRCVFCHNSLLVTNPDKEPELENDQVFSFLNLRKRVLNGIVITGGEPTLNPDLPDFIRELRERTGLPVKLDTNGTHPDMIKALLSEGLLDYIAMDIKSDLKGYSKIAGVEIDTDKVVENIWLIKNSGIEYEFRTTVVKEYFNKDVCEGIGKLLRGAERYYLQQFKMCQNVLGRGSFSLNPCSRKDMLAFKEILEQYVSFVELRGVD